MYKVLIVDDDKTVRYMLRRFQKWESYGFVIADEACDGKDALQKLAVQCFDLVITDIRMPGMDGLEFLSELKIRNLDICLVLLSTYNDFEYAQQGIRLGVFDYMTKPVDEHALGEALARIQRHLEEKRRLQSRLTEDNLRFYYPQSRERKLVDLMLAGSYTVIDEASCTCLELAKLTDQDLLKTGLLLEKILMNLSEEVYKDSPWLKNLENLVFAGTCTHAGSVGEINESFLNCITIILKMIKKYELHHPDSIVKKICRYVINHVEENIKLNKLADEMHVSRDYIGKLFKQKTGSSFTDYVTKVKMEHAKYLLGTGQYKNYEVTEKLGYRSPDYFCRLFKEYTGFTPLEFRKGT